MNWVASALLPEPAGPVTRMESPDGTPPPSISSRSATPVDSRFLGCFRSGSLLRRRMRGKTSRPSLVMRSVCSPGNGAWPRILATCSLRTPELRSMLWYSHRMPSATVNTGFLGASLSSYSPTRKVVACQVVRCSARRSRKPCSSSPPSRAAAAARTTVRKESTTTMPGLIRATSATIASNTVPRPCSSVS